MALVLRLVWLLALIVIVRAALLRPLSLYDHVERYLGGGGEEELRRRFGLQRGVVYNPLQFLTREDIGRGGEGYASDLEVLRALGVFVPGVDSVQRATERDTSDECVRGSGATLISGYSSEFAVTYSKSTPEHARAPVDFALRRWADVFQSDVQIRICFRWGGGGLGEMTLGATSSEFAARGEEFMSLRDDALYSPALASAKEGKDVLASNKWHLIMALNDKIDWHFDIGSRAPFTKYDLATTVLHELTHGLFFSGTIKADVGSETASYAERKAGQFDLFLQVGSVGVARTCTDGKDLYQAMINPTLRFVDRGAGISFRMYAPEEYETGSSTYHFNNVTFVQDCIDHAIGEAECSDLMTHQLENGYTQRSIGEPTLRVYRALRGDSPGVPQGEFCELPDVPHPTTSASFNSGKGKSTPFKFPTWGVATVAIIAGIGCILVLGVVVSSILSRREGE